MYLNKYDEKLKGYQFKTENGYFKAAEATLHNWGVENSEIILKTYDKKLKDFSFKSYNDMMSYMASLSPHNKKDIMRRITKECQKNIWFFFRELLFVDQRHFILSTETLIAIYAYTRDINVILIETEANESNFDGFCDIDGKSYLGLNKRYKSFPIQSYFTATSIASLFLYDYFIEYFPLMDYSFEKSSYSISCNVSDIFKDEYFRNYFLNVLNHFQTPFTKDVYMDTKIIQHFQFRIENFRKNSVNSLNLYAPILCIDFKKDGVVEDVLGFDIIRDNMINFDSIFNRRCYVGLQIPFDCTVSDRVNDRYSIEKMVDFIHTFASSKSIWIEKDDRYVIKDFLDTNHDENKYYKINTVLIGRKPIVYDIKLIGDKIYKRIEPSETIMKYLKTTEDFRNFGINL